MSRSLRVGPRRDVLGGAQRARLMRRCHKRMVDVTNVDLDDQLRGGLDLRHRYVLTTGQRDSLVVTGADLTTERSEAARLMGHCPRNTLGIGSLSRLAIDEDCARGLECWKQGVTEKL